MSPRTSLRESLSPSPLETSLRNSPNTAVGSDSDADMNDLPLRFGKSLAEMTHEELLALTGKLSSSGLKLGESPLDLSVPRKNAADVFIEAAQAQEKMALDMSRLSAWGLHLPPQIQQALALRRDLAATGFKPDFNLWNRHFQQDNNPLLSPFALGLQPPTSSESSKALERMSELSRRGAEGTLSSNASADLFRAGIGSLSASINNINSGGGSSGARTNVWQSSWLSKGQDTTRDVMKCVWCSASYSTLSELTTHIKEAKHCGVSLPPPSTSMASPIPPNRMANKTLSASHSTSSSRDRSSSSIKETMPLPRRLVRGQDVWLGKGAEQTKQILKCMWCGQSFKTLNDMTRHMQETQHYTNVISQEQIISWKSPEERDTNRSNVNAVLTCKVCDESFSSLKNLSMHMMKYSHYKEHVLRSASESGSRRRQTKEKRKKSLPVRKLLELERAQHDMKMSEVNMRQNSRIKCDKCGDKFSSVVFVDHIRRCTGCPGEPLKPSIISPNSDFSTKLEKVYDSSNKNQRTPERSNRDSPQSMDTDWEKKDNTKQPSVLNALEKLIEKSFQPGKSKQSNRNSPLGSSILRRLGIDESTDYTKPLMEQNMMHHAYSRWPGDSPTQRSSSNFPGPFGSDMHNSMNRSPHRSNSRPASNGSTTHGSEKSLDISTLDSPSSILEQSMDVHNTDRYNSDLKKFSNMFNGSLYNSDHDSNLKTNSMNINPDNSPYKSDSNLISKNNIKLEDGVIKSEDSHSDDRKEEIRVRSDIQINNDYGIKKEFNNDMPINQEIRIKDELRMRDSFGDRTDDNEGTIRNSPIGRLSGASPSTNSRSGTPHSDNGSNKSTPGGGLSALAGLFGGSSRGGMQGAHPLAALQKLCDKTENNPRQQPTTSSAQTNPGSIVAFSWACNDAVNGENIIKCSYCDVPFVSKGAYRHHLSKVHFVKDGIIGDSNGGKQANSSNFSNLNSGGGSNNNNSSYSIDGFNSHNNNNTNNNNEQKSNNPASPPLSQADTVQSKFLKYRDLAKQLSSK